MTKSNFDLQFLKFKKLNKNAVVPTRAHPSDAGFDITATAVEKDIDGIITYSTGIAVALPSGTCGLLMCRSSIFRYDLELTNSVGLLDQNYRGEIKFKFRPTDNNARIYEVGERIGQLVVLELPLLQIVEVDNLDSTDRGEGGFGSTNEKKPQS